MDRGEFRQWALLLAMQGMLANSAGFGMPADTIVRSAHILADALVESNTVDESEGERL